MDDRNVMICSKCGKKSEDVAKDPHAWDGWTILPKPVCPECQEKSSTEQAIDRN